MNSLSEKLSALLAAEKAATPGEWRPFIAPDVRSIYAGECEIVNWQGFDDSNIPRSQHEANVRFLARSRNAIRELAEVAMAAQPFAEAAKGHGGGSDEHCSVCCLARALAALDAYRRRRVA